ncbi:GAF domain-containing sensor histidine kinase, partial [bacterium]|nr:GAF domain-containing sensor histidine kinase [bacterium]
KIFKNWAKDVLIICLHGIHTIGCGGYLVPQLGEDSGHDTYSFVQTNNDQNIKELVKTIYKRLDDFWNVLHTEPCEYQLPDLLDEMSSFALVVSPVTYIFDRPIGYFWAVCNKDQVVETEDALKFSVILVALLVHYHKANFSLKLLSKPVWQEKESSKKSAYRIAESCLKALSCKATIIWHVVKGRSKNMLKTLATAGNAKGVSFDMTFGQGVAGICVAEGKPILIDDLWDMEELRRFGIKKVAHARLVKQLKFRSAIFVPLDIGSHIQGVLGAYTDRPRGFSSVDKNITIAFSQRLSAGYVHTTRLEELTEMESRLKIATPLIETGMSAMDNVHDVNSTLLLVQNKLNIIREKTRDKKKGQIYKAATKAASQVNTSSKLLNEIINHSKITKLSYSKCEFRPFIDDIIDSIKDRSTRINIKIFNNCPQGIYAHVDKLKIRRVFNNLIDNALYFLGTDRKGTQRKIEIDITDRKDGFIETHIKDNGPGISDSEIDHIFDFLYSTKGEDGSGLGLAIAKLIVENHGGKITANSKWGYSAEFKFTLPVTPKKTTVQHL